MNRGQIRERVITDINESSPPVSVLTEELNEYIDDAYQEVARVTGAVVTDVTLDCGAGNPYVKLPDNMLRPLAIIDVGNGRPIDLKHWTFVDKVDAQFIRRSRTSPWFACAWGFKELLLYPSYSAAGQITITGTIIPAAMTSDSDVPDIPEQYHRGLAYYAAHHALIKDADGPRFGRALRKLRDYRDALGEIDLWADSRHENIHMAVYGTKLRDGEKLDLPGGE
jgi:hypothetical protein